METIYLDYNATAPLNHEIRDELFELWAQDEILNPSSIHWAGRKAKTFESARRRIAYYFDRKPSEVIFTSGGSEAGQYGAFGHSR